MSAQPTTTTLGAPRSTDTDKNAQLAIRTAEQDDDPYWIEHYSSFVLDFDRPATAPPEPTKALIQVPPRSPKRSSVKTRRLTPFPPLSKFSNFGLSKSAKSPIISPKTDISESGNGTSISIFPSEILSPSGSDPSEGRASEDVESPLKAVRFAHINTYHSTGPAAIVHSRPRIEYTTATTSATHTRTHSDSKREKHSHRAKDSRPASDPTPPHVAVAGKDLPLRGDRPVKMSSRSAHNGKRVERERGESLRTRGYMYERTGREYGPPNLPRPIRPAPRDLETIARVESSLILQSFTCSDAWALGCALRERLLPHDKPAVINIALSSGQVLFHCCTKSGSTLDHSAWIDRKRNSVIRWGVSTWYLGMKYAGDESLFAYKNGLGVAETGRFAMSGGGMPIRVQGVEGVVAVVVVSGLKGDENHEVIVETIQEHWY